VFYSVCCVISNPDLPYHLLSDARYGLCKSARCGLARDVSTATPFLRAWFIPLPLPNQIRDNDLILKFSLLIGRTHDNHHNLQFLPSPPFPPPSSSSSTSTSPQYLSIMATMAANSDRDVSQPTCQNCTTSTTPLWRRDEIGSVLCNACGLFLKLHGRPRPISLKTDVIKSRNRVKSSGAAPNAKKKVCLYLSLVVRVVIPRALCPASLSPIVYRQRH
jgi:GATA zinc finger